MPGFGPPVPPYPPMVTTSAAGVTAGVASPVAGTYYLGDSGGHDLPFPKYTMVDPRRIGE